MKLTNDSYLIRMGTKNFAERYYRDADGWLKVSARGRPFRMTAEQVLNHLLPALAGVKPNLLLKEVRYVKSKTPTTPSVHAARVKKTNGINAKSAFSKIHIHSDGNIL